MERRGAGMDRGASDLVILMALRCITKTRQLPLTHPLPLSLSRTPSPTHSLTHTSIILSSGFCVAKPYNVKARKNFFVDLKLPQSVARHEQIQIKAVLHNYGQKSLQVITL